jgi:hypothetical protein
MKHGRESWYDGEAGPMVRPYALTRGRTRSDRHALNMITLLVAVHTAVPGMDPEYVQILGLCKRPQSVAELAALLDVPLAVLKVLVSDLIDEGYLIFRSPPQSEDVPDLKTLQAVLDGIRRL